MAFLLQGLGNREAALKMCALFNLWSEHPGGGSKGALGWETWLASQGWGSGLRTRVDMSGLGIRVAEQDLRVRVGDQN